MAQLPLKPPPALKRDNWPAWGNDPHNPFSGKDRPAFNWARYRDYCRGYVDADGNPVADSESSQPRKPGR